MASKLQCEICGGKLVGKAGGIYECDSCGMEYDTTWVKEKIQQIQGTVKVEGTVEVTGKVQVDLKANKGALLKRANMLLEDGDWDGADRYGDQVLDIDPECAEAYLIKYLAARKLHKEAEIAEAVEKAVILKERKNGSYSRAVEFIQELQGSSFTEAGEFVRSLPKEMHLTNQQKNQAKQFFVVLEKAEILGGDPQKDPNYTKLMRYASPELSDRISSYLSVAQEKVCVIEDRRHTEETEYEIKRKAEQVRFQKQFEEEQRQKEEKRKQRLQTRQADLKKYVSAARLISTRSSEAIGLQTDGMMTRKSIFSGTDIVSVSEGDGALFGIKADGTVIANDFFVQGSRFIDVVKAASGWTNIKEIVTGSDHIVGLKADGTVVAVGDNEKGQCEVSDWRDTAAIAAGYQYTLGLKTDGTVVGAGHIYKKAVYTWSDIVAITGGSYHIVGLKADGTVVAAEQIDPTIRSVYYKGQCDVTGPDWENIVVIAAGSYHTIGLKADGTVIATRIPQKGSLSFIQERDKAHDHGQCDVRAWTDIVAIATNDYITVGLKRDGSVVSTSETGGTKTYDWKLFDRFEAIAEEQKTKIKANRMKRLQEAETELENMKTELANLKGLFTGKRRSELEQQIPQLEQTVKRIKADVEKYKRLES